MLTGFGFRSQFLSRKVVSGRIILSSGIFGPFVEYIPKFLKQGFIRNEFITYSKVKSKAIPVTGRGGL
jgi:hypothetical protein